MRKLDISIVVALVVAAIGGVWAAGEKLATKYEVLSVQQKSQADLTLHELEVALEDLEVLELKQAAELPLTTREKVLIKALNRKVLYLQARYSALLPLNTSPGGVASANER